MIDMIDMIWYDMIAGLLSCGAVCYWLHKVGFKVWVSGPNS